MNTPKFHDIIYIIIDRVGSKRFQRSKITDILNMSANDIIKDRYDNIKKETGYSFELVERLKQELYSLVVKVTLPVTNNEIIVPNDFQYELLTFITINGKRVRSEAISYNESDRNQNTFTRPTNEYPTHLRTATGYAFEYTGTATEVDLYYLKKKREFSFGNAKFLTGVNLVVGANYYVEDAPVIHNGITHNPESSFIATTTSFTGTGSLTPFVDTDLPELLHDEIAKWAAGILSGAPENFNKAAWIEKKIKDS